MLFEGVLYLYTSHGDSTTRSEPYHQGISRDIQGLMKMADKDYPADDAGWNSGCWIQDQSGSIIAERHNNQWKLHNMRYLPVRSCQIRCKEHPEWGTWGIMDDHGLYYDIHGDSGGRILSKDEAVQFWEVVQ